MVADPQKFCGEAAVGAEGSAFMVRFTPLSVPFIAGSLLMTRIRYPVPEAVPAGIVADMAPAAVLERVPIFTGEAKLPDASESCAVKTFPLLNAPEIVKGTETIVPAQKGEPEMDEVVIVADAETV